MGQCASVRTLAAIRFFRLVLRGWLGIAGGYAAQQTLPALTEADRTIKQCPGQPGAAGSERSFSRYALSAEAEGRTKLRVRREITILKNRIPADQYPVLKSFFDQARAGDEGQVVLAVEKK